MFDVVFFFFTIVSIASINELIFSFFNEDIMIGLLYIELIFEKKFISDILSILLNTKRLVFLSQLSSFNVALIVFMCPSISVDEISINLK